MCVRRALHEYPSRATTASRDSNGEARLADRGFHTMPLAWWSSAGSTAQPCPTTREQAVVRLAWDRVPAAGRLVRAWARRLASSDANSSRSGGQAWSRYLHSVYGPDVPNDVSVRALRWFWWWAPGSRNLTRLEMPVWRSIQPGDLWVPGLRIERHLSMAGFFLQPSRPEPLRRAGFPSGGAVEVMRVAHPPGESPDTAFGPEAASTSQSWYWHAPGSGVYLSLGRTLAIPNRSALLGQLARLLPAHPSPFSMKRVEVAREHGLRLCDGCSMDSWLAFDVVWAAQPSVETGLPSAAQPLLCDSVRLAGYETVQLYAAFGGQRFEIIDCRLQAGATITGRRVADTVEAALARTHGERPPSAWVSACAPPETSAHVSAGGAAPGARPCACLASLPFLNCGQCARAAAVWRVAQPHSSGKWVKAPQENSSMRRAAYAA